MTREEAIDILKHPNEEYHGSDGTSGYTFYPNRKNYEAFQLAIKALEQEPVLDKITEEIQKLRGCSCWDSDGIIDDVEDIIDKYRVESEDKE